MDDEPQFEGLNKRLWNIVNDALIAESKRAARYFLPKGRYITRRDAIKAYEFAAQSARNFVAEDLRKIANMLDLMPKPMYTWENKIRKQAKEYANEAVPEEAEDN